MSRELIGLVIHTTTKWFFFRYCRHTVFSPYAFMYLARMVAKEIQQRISILFTCEVLHQFIVSENDDRMHFLSLVLLEATNSMEE